jgi:hypothetical protein
MRWRLPASSNSFGGGLGHRGSCADQMMLKGAGEAFEEGPELEFGGLRCLFDY